MAKGGYQKRRIQAKKERERQARRRRERNRKITIVVSIVLVLGLIGAIAAIAIGGGEPNLAADGSPTPSASAPSTTASFADPCTEPGPDTLGKKSFDLPPCKIIDESKTYTATMDTNKGTITIDLFAAAAPVTVNNFVFLAQQGFYDDTIFHRVIADFAGTAMIQGGDAANRNGTGGPGYQFGDENLIPFDQGGYLAMANSGPGTNGSQFFILEGTVQHLNAPGQCPGPSGCHSIFGQVTKGLDVVKKIANVKTGQNDMPVKDVVIRKVTITEG